MKNGQRKLSLDSLLSLDEPRDIFVYQFPTDMYDCFIIRNPALLSSKYKNRSKVAAKIVSKLLQLVFFITSFRLSEFIDA